MKFVNKSVTFCTLIALAVPALAVTTITCANATIAAPGNYQLTSNLACTLSITSSGVALKLNGWTITPPANHDGIDINVGGGGRLNHDTVQGPGLISGLSSNVQGIHIVNTDYSLIESVTIVAQPGGAGLAADGNTFLTLTSNMVGGANRGIGAGSCTSCVISSNDASGNFTGIFVSSGSNNTVNNNTANGNTGFGIIITNENGTRVYGNITNGNTGYGIAVQGPGVQIFSNISSQANGADDMLDGSITCSGDYWSNNVFLTSNQTCIH
jgi:parallel beta-helix repeat protein